MVVSVENDLIELLDANTYHCLSAIHTHTHTLLLYVWWAVLHVVMQY